MNKNTFQLLDIFLITNEFMLCINPSVAKCSLNFELIVAYYYRKPANIRRTLVSNNMVDHSDVVGASLVGVAPTTSSFLT